MCRQLLEDNERISVYTEYSPEPGSLCQSYVDIQSMKKIGYDVFVRGYDKILYRAVRKGTATFYYWFEKILDTPINPQFYVYGAFIYAKSNSDGDHIRTRRNPMKLANRKVFSVGLDKYSKARDAGKNESLFQKQRIPQAVWDKMIPLQIFNNKNTVQCHLLCEENEECNMFRWEDGTCTIAYVSSHSTGRSLETDKIYPLITRASMQPIVWDRWHFAHLIGSC